MNRFFWGYGCGILFFVALFVAGSLMGHGTITINGHTIGYSK